MASRVASALPTRISVEVTSRSSASALSTAVVTSAIESDTTSGTATPSGRGNEGQALNFRTNVDDWVACGPEHALRFEPERATGGLKPYLHVRRGLWAKVTRALLYDLVELGEEREVDGKRMFGVTSAGAFFAMAPADSLKDIVA